MPLFAGRWVERTGRYRMWPIVGGVIMMIGALALTTIDLDTPAAVVAGMGAIVGIGIGCAMQTSILAVQNAVDLADMGMGTSTALLARTLGGTIGTPLFGAVLSAIFLGESLLWYHYVGASLIFAGLFTASRARRATSSLAPAR